MREWIIGIMVVIIIAAIAGWAGKSDAQTMTIVTEDGELVTLTCFTIDDESGDIFCE